MAKRWDDIPLSLKAALEAATPQHPDDDIALRARRAAIASFIKEAEAGDVEAAKALLNRAAAWIAFDVPMTPELRTYLARAFYRIACGKDPGRALHLKRKRGRPQTKHSDPPRDWLILEKVSAYKHEADSSLEDAFFKVAEELGLTQERVRDIWYQMGGEKGLPLYIDPES